MPLHRARPRESDDEYLGWIVPAYPMPPGLDDTHVLRVVVRNGFGRDLARTFVDDLRRGVEQLQAGGGRVDPGDRAGFHHSRVLH